MIKLFVTAAYVTAALLCRSQDNMTQYVVLKTQGDSLAAIKDFKGAAIAYSMAIKFAGEASSNDDRWNAACFWMAANCPDSAFVELYEVATTRELSFDYINDILGDNGCFLSLHNDSRWPDVRSKMVAKAYENYLNDRDKAEKAFIPNEKEKKFILALGNLNDSAIDHLNDQGYFYIKQKKFDKAYRYIKTSLIYFPPNSVLSTNMGDYYSAIGDKERAFTYYARALNIKYKYLSINPDSSLKIESSIDEDYQALTKQSGIKAVPTDYLLSTLAAKYLQNGWKEKSFAISNMNIAMHPKSFMANKSMSDYYKSIGDKENEDKYSKNAQFIRDNSKPVTSYLRKITELIYDARVDDPAYKENGPTILFDEAHNNHHTASNRYKPFAELMQNDGYQIIKASTAITDQLLAKASVVIIAAPTRPMANSELTILNSWIRNGGSLLTITDHNNFNFDGLLEVLGIQAPETEYTEDSVNARLLENGFIRNPRHIVFSGDLLGDHPIIKGRNENEKIKIVKTFSGRTIIPPAGSTILLRLSSTAIDYLTIEPALRTVESSVAVKCNGTRAYGAAFTLGKGRVVVVSEAAMLTVQKIDGGFNTPGCDNRQFALNIMRWLSGYLK